MDTLLREPQHVYTATGCSIDCRRAFEVVVAIGDVAAAVGAIADLAGRVVEWHSRRRSRAEDDAQPEPPPPPAPDAPPVRLEELVAAQAGDPGPSDADLDAVEPEPGGGDR